MVRTLYALLVLVTFVKVSVGDNDHSSHGSHSHGFDHFHDHEHEHLHKSDHYNNYTANQLWMDTIGSVVGISVAPFILLFLLPDLNKHRDFLQILLGFAGGGLLGDAFLHLIPHALSHFHGHNHNDAHGHSHSLGDKNTHVFLWVIGGIFGFLFIDKLLRILRCGHDLTHRLPVAEKSDKKPKNAKSCSSDGSNKIKAKNSSGMATAGYLNLAADFTHNFTDGIAIAGSFLISRNVGYVTTLTVLIHELPHEIGDYAILIMSGCGVYRAMLLQLVTALGAILGASLSLLAAGVRIDDTESIGSSVRLSSEFVTTCLLPFTAGGFIYVALVSVLPDLLTDQQSGENRNRIKVTRRIRQMAAELTAVVVGVAMMAVIGLFE